VVATFPGSGVAGGPVHTFLALAVALLTFLTYVPVLRNGFVWDDNFIFLANPDYRGLGWPQVRWMLSGPFAGHYAPLTWLTHGLDYVLWGLNPVGYHLTHLLLHAANAALFYLVARALLDRRGSLSPTGVAVGATTAALIFGVHPLHVESVAWATERRDVLSGCFFLLTIYAYLAAAGARGRRRRWLLAASLAAYVLAAASKPIVMTLPAVLVVLDVYPLGRLPPTPRRWLDRPAWPLWLEKVPYGLVALATAVMAVHAQRAGLRPLQEYPVPARIGMAIYNLWFHVHKTILPILLSPLYELPDHISLLEPRFLVSGIAVFTVGALVILRASAWPAGLAASVAYVILLAPVSGLFPNGPQLVADRYSYLATMPGAILIGAGVAVARDRFARRASGWLGARSILGATLVGLLGLAVLTSRQVAVWHDSESLWRRAVEVNGDCVRCRLNLGGALMDKGAWLPAIEHFQAAVLLDPDQLWAYNNVGIALAALGRFPQAIDHYQLVLAKHPGSLKVSANLATALLALGRSGEAVEELRRAIQANDPEVALSFFQEAVTTAPQAAVPRLGLLATYGVLRQWELAREQREALRALDPALGQVADAIPLP
jgi:protein O-mannosyl-transferase